MTARGDALFDALHVQLRGRQARIPDVNLRTCPGQQHVRQRGCAQRGFEREVEARTKGARQSVTAHCPGMCIGRLLVHARM